MCDVGLFSEKYGMSFRTTQKQTAHEIKAQYKDVSILKNRRVVFNIKGNHHRLIVAVAFRLGAVYIKFIGTHEEYDRINADHVEL